MSKPQSQQNGGPKRTAVYILLYPATYRKNSLEFFPKNPVTPVSYLKGFSVG